MSDTQIFLIGIFASVLIVIHVAVIFTQMRKLDDAEAEPVKERTPQPRRRSR